MWRWTRYKKQPPPRNKRHWTSNFNPDKRSISERGYHSETKRTRAEWTETFYTAFFSPSTYILQTGLLLGDRSILCINFITIACNCVWTAALYTNEWMNEWTNEPVNQMNQINAIRQQSKEKCLSTQLTDKKLLPGWAVDFLSLPPSLSFFPLL